MGLSRDSKPRYVLVGEDFDWNETMNHETKTTNHQTFDFKGANIEKKKLIGLATAMNF
jgi:hypothetical protein